MQRPHFLRQRMTTVMVAAVCALALWPSSAQAQTAAVLFERAKTREAAARTTPTVGALRAAVAAYEQVVQRHPRSDYCDDALWNAATLARFSWESVQDSIDLHGMTLVEAEEALSCFFRRSIQKRLFCVKVIHGRGLRSPQGPVLKEALKRFLHRSFSKWSPGLCYCQA